MEGKIVRNQKLNDKYYLLEIKCEEFVREAKVGQFVMINTRHQDYTSDPLLRRPLGVADVNGDRFTLVYMVVGKGTMLLSEMKKDAVVSFSSPQGSTFSMVEKQRTALLAGGIGIAPVYWLAKALKDRGCVVDLYYGGRTVDDVVLLEELKENTDHLIVTTDDGSAGIKGLVVAPFEENIASYDIVYACGPKGMLRAVSNICVKHELPVEVSLDERMACGLGACLGCIIYLKEGDSVVQKRCCVEGPVFDGSKVVWDTVCQG
ncbi:oxidoreductase FAD/NAD(P)-binding domain protein [Denitrovibrio acetiphilus DSM 12809]|jgi:dihydroorotate dehydrogenase electron transfer subunit|uniref:Oxidoreductase FAD/NAD(P)-binding domain protein n=1 Tax=Denitrovibrio acetiphilus (strain DSM 12809 / NBRC 114555 / N2460) TaxID=522772 RepID=D4H843_DENA2|nr:dihydroorotate dehydrogenase electron transfer subunit [Denitrovibrio acetiphilus]ADD68192.1 oxidoreductase FAD/NAD(P)-binding domain protein [Denitrovibrio acetiphilus DSM 12809]